MDLSNQELETLITKANDIFYDKVYEDAWLKDVFGLTDIDMIKKVQSDFILGTMGGPKRYSGRSPKDAHPHIFIQEDMWDLREKYLKEAFVETNIPKQMQERWLNIDNAFKSKILKKSADECFGRYRTEEIINIPKPKGDITLN